MGFGNTNVLEMGGEHAFYGLFAEEVQVVEIEILLHPRRDFDHEKPAFTKQLITFSDG